MTRSVERRFLALVGGAVLVCIVPLFLIFLSLSADRAKVDQRNDVSMLLTANAQALAKPLWDFDVDGARRIATAIVSSPTISRVEVKDMTGGIHVILPATDPIVAEPDLLSLTHNIAYAHVDGLKPVGTVTAYYRPQSLLSNVRPTEAVFIGIFVLAVLLVLAAAVVSNRLMIMRPLLRLTAAIEATARDGARHSVDWSSTDEMGRLAVSFNAMQKKLQQEESELKFAHRLATDIYNATPAMLFSIDARHGLASVSDYWVQATGYRREAVLGRSFADLLAPAARAPYETLRQAPREGNRWELTTQFVCADGRVMDVLIMESALANPLHGETMSLSVMTDITALKQSEACNRKQALTDHLTGLMNRQGFEQALDTEIAQVDREGGTLACLFVDLDRFKWINDNLGHQAGDATLCKLVAMIVPLLPQQASAARIGGDEFAILLRAEDTEATAVKVAQEICGLFDKPLTVKGTATRLSASIGIALYPHHAESAAELLQKADMAMYARKRDGKNGLQLFDDRIGSRTRQRAEIERLLEQALRGDWFDAYLQPIIDMKTGRTVGYEALMRLCHPERGVLSPAEIISVAEETGAIHEIGKQVFGKAMEHFVDITALSGDADTYLALNISPIQIEPDLTVWLTSAMHLFDLDPKRIVLEITEATLLHDNPQIQTILKRIVQVGCRIALDDFGTGYSSLSYLGRFPVDIIKIDQSFIRSMTGETSEQRERSRMLIESMSAISHRMQCTVVAEGIETEEQHRALCAINIDHGQGYLFDRPLAFADLKQRFERPAAEKLCAAQ